MTIYFNNSTYYYDLADKKILYQQPLDFYLKLYNGNSHLNDYQNVLELRFDVTLYMRYFERKLEILTLALRGNSTEQNLQFRQQVEAYFKKHSEFINYSLEESIKLIKSFHKKETESIIGIIEI
ncbi:MAG: hypothetical protein EOM67_00295 [Spirochaetia bacterium]|nr:hypothetical protein [Spirochaetia bacterium]